jgi:hypothetical protein
MNRWLGLAAIFAIAVLAGCSSQSRHSSPTTGALSHHTAYSEDTACAHRQNT